MSSIELSAGFVTDMVPRITKLNDYTGVASNSANSGLLCRYAANTALGELMLMQGTIPALPNLTSINSRISDILVRCSNYDGSYGSPNTMFSATFNGSLATFNTQYTSASASGTATWFWGVTVLTNLNTNTNPLYQQFIGTVGTVGSGADLEMADVNIVSGQAYRFANLKINFPTSWSY